MRIPGVSVFCVAASLLVAQSLTQISPGNGGLIGAKCEKT
jgi:hypothetical protein